MKVTLEFNDNDFDGEARIRRCLSSDNVYHMLVDYNKVIHDILNKDLDNLSPDVYEQTSKMVILFHDMLEKYNIDLNDAPD